MEDKNAVGVTVISHDSELRGHVNGCRKEGCFSRNVTYARSTPSQLVSLSRVTSHCEQFIMFECNNDVSFIEFEYTRWISREGKAMHFWGGAAPGIRSCTCGVKNRCIGGGKCNCRNYGPVGSPMRGWRNDSGFLTDKFSLPRDTVKIWGCEKCRWRGILYFREAQVLWNYSWSSCRYFLFSKTV